MRVSSGVSKRHFSVLRLHIQLSNGGNFVWKRHSRDKFLDEVMHALKDKKKLEKDRRLGLPHGKSETKIMHCKIRSNNYCF
jgi:hypothetical protein